MIIFIMGTNNSDHVCSLLYCYKDITDLQAIRISFYFLAK